MNGKISERFNFPGCFHPDYEAWGHDCEGNLFLFPAEGLWRTTSL